MKKGFFSKTLVALLVLSLVAGLALTGCGGDKEKADKGKGNKDFELNVIVGPEPKTIDPALNTAVDGGIMLNHLFEGLMTYDAKGKIVNGVAEKVDISEDELTYTFHFRDGLKWSDGKPLTAKDFVFSWKRLLDPRTAADYSYMLESIKGASEVMEADPKNASAIEAVLNNLAISAPDDKTFKVELIAKTPYFKDICAFPATFPVREDIVSDKNWTQDPKKYIGNGPYKMTEWKHQAVIKTVKNKNYRDQKVIGPAKINFNLVEDANANLAAFKNNEDLFVDDIPNQELKSMEGQGLKIAPQLGTYFLCLNQNDPLMKNKKLREALSLAIDRNYIVEKVSLGGETPADNFVPVGVKSEKDGVEFHKNAKAWYSVKKSDYKKNVKKAKKLLAEAGYPDGKGLKTLEISFNTNGNHQPIAEAVQNMWKTELGVNAQLSGQEWNVFIQTRKNADYQIARHGWIADYNDPISFLDMWVTGTGNNDAKWSNAEYDKLIKNVKATGDPEKRFADMYKAQEILGEDLPIIPIYFYSDPYLISPDLKGVVVTPLGFKIFTFASLEK